MIICKHDLPRLRDLLIKEGNRCAAQRLRCGPGGGRSRLGLDDELQHLSNGLAGRQQCLSCIKQGGFCVYGLHGFPGAAVKCAEHQCSRPNNLTMLRSVQRTGSERQTNLVQDQSISCSIGIQFAFASHPTLSGLVSLPGRARHYAGAPGYLLLTYFSRRTCGVGNPASFSASKVASTMSGLPHR